MSIFQVLQTWCPCARPRHKAAEPVAESEPLLAPSKYNPAPVLLPSATVDSILDTLKNDMISLATPTELAAERVEVPESLTETPADAELAERLRAALAKS